jgi:hypothetical protein
VVEHSPHTALPLGQIAHFGLQEIDASFNFLSDSF